MSEIVVHVDRTAGLPGPSCRVESPYNFDEVVSVLSVDNLAGVLPPQVVRQVGEGLCAQLRLNPTVNQVLTMVLAHPAAPPSLPILFKIGDPIAHALSWESLIADNDFLALNARWPIARIARGSALDRDPVRACVSPVRLTCVLSAAGESAAAEWQGIYAAVQQIRAAGLAVSVTLIAGEEAVLDAAAGLGDADLTVHPAPAPAADVPLVRLVEQSEPHLLHLFAHGTVVNGIGMIELATVNDTVAALEGDPPTSSVVVRAEELGLAAARAGVWAVVLNACRGADAGDVALTHAEDIVAQGVPAAVGMRRQVHVDDAAAFSREWYPAVFAELRRIRACGPGRQALSWADMLLAARQRLRDLHGGDPGDDDTWTIPVLYKLPGTFSLEVSPAGEGEEVTGARLSENDALGGLLAVLPEDMDPMVASDLQGLVS